MGTRTTQCLYIHQASIKFDQQQIFHRSSCIVLLFKQAPFLLNPCNAPLAGRNLLQYKKGKCLATPCHVSSDTTWSLGYSLSLQAKLFAFALTPLDWSSCRCLDQTYNEAKTSNRIGIRIRWRL